MKNRNYYNIRDKLGRFMKVDPDKKHKCKWCKKIFLKRRTKNIYCSQTCSHKGFGRKLRYMRIMDNKRKELAGIKKQIKIESVKDFFARLKKEREENLQNT